MRNGFENVNVKKFAFLMFFIFVVVVYIWKKIRHKNCLITYSAESE